MPLHSTSGGGRKDPGPKLLSPRDGTIFAANSSPISKSAAVPVTTRHSIVPQLCYPIEARGTRIIAMLLVALENRGLKRGVASLCIGGGKANAMAFELA